MAGYSEGNWNCTGTAGAVNGNPQTGSVVIAANENVTCTIINNDIAPTLQLNKHVINNNGGAANASAWTLTATGSGGFSGTGLPATGVDASIGPNNVTAGIQYTLSESGGPSGYSTTGIWSCTGTGSFVSPNKITLAVGQTASCTITNDDIAPTLQLNKHVINNNGGTANASAWTLTATGSGGFSGNGAPATGVDASIGPNNVTAGIQYALGESGGPSGYSTTGIWSCTGTGSFVSPNLITVAVGQTASCTITNDDIAPTLQLNKHVINNNGGTANASAWTLTATGSGGFSGNGAPATGTDASIGPNGVTAGVQYALSESGGPSGYSTTGIWSCTGAGTFVSPNLITLAVGQTASCTITNDDIAPTLQLNKHVINNNGGTANASAWTLTATGTGGFSGTGTPATGVDAHIGPNNVNAGIQYALTESGGPSGYSTTGIWNCTGTGTFVSPNLITLAVGQTASCTITNDDIAPQLTLNKHVINNNGGTANASAWTLTVAGSGGFSGAGTPATGPDAANGPNNVTAGIQYTLSESGGPAGYSTTGVWSCTGAGTFVSPNLITLAVGQTASCTITNDDIAPTLQLNKHVINNNGGTANASAWTLTATGSGGFSGNGAPATGVDASIGPNNVTAGIQYALGESGGPSGYSTTAVWSCTGTGSFTSPNLITLAVGQTASCTITNDDIAPTLQLNKHVINDNGGTANASAWTLTAAGSGGFSGTGAPATGVDASNGPNSVTANVQYTLSESGGPSGYSSSGVWNCTGSGTFATPNKITLGPGQSASCTITNDDIAPTLKVVKLLVPSADSGLFNLLIDGTARATNVGNNGNTGFVTVNAGSHSVSETAGTATSLDSYSSVIGGDYAADGLITLSLAQNATCTITNRRLPTLIVQKTIMGQSTQFEFTATGTPTNPPNGDIFLTPPTDGSIQSDSQIIQPGSFVVNEVNLPANWMLTDFTCTSNNASGTFLYTPATIGGTFAAGYGDNVLCSFVDDQQGGTTRTQGFWSTHTFLANAIWNGTALPPGTSTITPVPVIGSADAKLCTANDITANPTPEHSNQLMGGFWANVANSTRTTKKRSALDKIRMQFLQQYLAAVLNVHAFGTVIPGTSLATARAAYCGTDTDAIHTQQTLLATYNESGDSGIFTPGASATPNESRLEADIAFWDTTFRLFDPTQVDGGGKVNTTVTTRPTTTTKSTPVLNILVLPIFDDQTTTDTDKPADKPKVKRPVIE